MWIWQEAVVSLSITHTYDGIQNLGIRNKKVVENSAPPPSRTLLRLLKLTVQKINTS